METALTGYEEINFDVKTWIVTGGAASGKSSFCKLLAGMSSKVAYYSSDRAVHELFESKEVKDHLVELFGSKVLKEDREVDREWLRQRVFADATERKKLESLLHPLAFLKLEELRNRLESEGNTQLLIAEVPLFYETGREFPADLVIVVAVSPDVQRQRMMENRGLNSVEAARILDAQLPLVSKLERADKVVWNEGHHDLLSRQAQLLLHQVIPQHAD